MPSRSPLHLDPQEPLVKPWRAPHTLQTVLYLLVAVLFAGLAAAGLLQLLPFVRGPVEEWPVSLRLFGFALATLLAGIAAAVALLQATRAAALSYLLDRNAVVVVQRGWRHVIPLDRIVAVATPEEQPVSSGSKPFRRFGRGSRGQRLVIETGSMRYQLAIRRREDFARELNERRRLGVVQPQREGFIRTAQLWPAFIGSPTVRTLLVLVLVLNLALWSVLSWRYPLLPETVPIRFDPIGGTAGARPRTYTLLLSSVGSGLALLNCGLALAVCRRTRLGSELLLLGAFLVQVILLAAISFIATSAR